MRKKHEFAVNNVVGKTEVENYSLEEVEETLDGDRPAENVVRVDRDGAMILVYPDGTSIVRAEDQDVLEENFNWLSERFDENDIVEKSSLENVLSTLRLDQEIPLDEFPEKEEDLEAGSDSVVIDSEEYKCTFQMFKNGEIVSVGASSVEDARKESKRLAETL